MRLRQSTIQTWMRCALQAKFQMLDDLPSPQNARATWGTCVHYGLEKYSETCDVDAAVAAYLEAWDNPELLNAAPDYWPKYMTKGSFREKGVQLIRNHHDRIVWEWRHVLAWEHRFLVPFGNHELEGTVDLVEIRKNGRGKKIMRICDYKTNNKAPTQQELQWNIQFTTYMYASQQPEFWLGNGDEFPPMPNGQEYWDDYGHLPRRAIWFHLQTNKELDGGARTEQDFMRLHRVVHEIEKAVERDVFVPDISGESCLYCPYTEPCGLSLTPVEEVMEQEDAWI